MENYGEPGAALGTGDSSHEGSSQSRENEPGKRESELGMSNRPKSRRRLPLPLGGGCQGRHLKKTTLVQSFED